MQTTTLKYDDNREDHQGANKTNKQQMDRARLQIHHFQNPQNITYHVLCIGRALLLCVTGEMPIECVKSKNTQEASHLVKS